MPLTPNNREEHWLQGMVDGSTDLTPNNRREHWYKEIIDNGSGGGGGGGGALIVHEDADGVLDKTWKEINDSDLSIIIEDRPPFKAYFFVTGTINTGESYVIQTLSSVMGQSVYLSYSASNETDYPVIDE